MAEKKSSTVPLDWNEVYFTNCPMVSANNIDQELGWCKTDFKKIGVDYSYFRSRRENDFYPHYIHNLDNLIRFGGLYPPIEVHADIRRTRLLGATWVYEGGCMLVRARDPIYRMQDLKGKKIGLSKSLNTIKNDWWRITEHLGIESMLRLNDMTMEDGQFQSKGYITYQSKGDSIDVIWGYHADIGGNIILKYVMVFFKPYIEHDFDEGLQGLQKLVEFDSISEPTEVDSI